MPVKYNISLFVFNSIQKITYTVHVLLRSADIELLLGSPDEKYQELLQKLCNKYLK